MNESEPPDVTLPTTSRPKGRLRRNITGHLRRNIITGSLLMIPVALTYFVVRFIFDFVVGVLGPATHWVFQRSGFDWTLSGLAVVVAVLLIYLVGVFLANALGRRLVRWGQAALLRVPFVGTVYTPARKLVESFSGTGKTGFKRVVLVQYSRAGAWSIGFLTGLTETSENNRLAVVYVLTSPFPNSWLVAIFPIDDVLDTDLSLQAAIQLIFSGGIVSPQAIKTRKLNTETALASTLPQKTEKGAR